MKKAIILLSGGLDSTTVSAIAKNQNYELYGISFDYDQRHKGELEVAKKTAKRFGFKEHKIIKSGVGQLGGSALTADIAVPKDKKIEDIGKEIPITYVPARNVIFLSYALGYSETINCFDIFIGVNSVDFSGYPDCTPEFIKAFEDMANISASIVKKTGNKIKIHSPLENMTKKEIIQTGIKLGVDYAETVTCYDYDPNLGACGTCESCKLRLNGFKEAGIKDPAKYRIEIY